MEVKWASPHPWAISRELYFPLFSHYLTLIPTFHSLRGRRNLKRDGKFFFFSKYKSLLTHPLAEIAHPPLGTDELRIEGFNNLRLFKNPLFWLHQRVGLVYVTYIRWYLRKWCARVKRYKNRNNWNENRHFENVFNFETSVELNRCLKQIKLHISLYTRMAHISEVQSNITTMVYIIDIYIFLWFTYLVEVPRPLARPPHPPPSRGMCSGSGWNKAHLLVIFFAFWRRKNS